MAKGNISVDSENLFPIIKKWLYSDKDIFLRELVSNGCDAVTKLKKLASIGEAQIDENEKFKVTVSIFKDAKKLVISDNGIGMTAEEIDKYINQIAFSGASRLPFKVQRGGRQRFSNYRSFRTLVFTVRLWLPTVLKLIRFHIKTVQRPQTGLVTEVWNLT